MDTDFTVADARSGGSWVVHVTGELDILSAPQLRDHVLAALVHTSAARLVLDLSAVTFIDSAGLGFTIALLKRAVRAGLSVAVVVTHPEVVRLFAITGVGAAFPVFTSLDEATREP